MFLVIPVGVDYRTQRLPVVTFTLIGINVAVYLALFAYQVAGGAEATRWIYDNLWLTPSQPSLLAYVSTLFVHGGLFHLLGNMVYLFLFGACVEDMIGRGRFTAFYFLGGFASDLLHILIARGSAAAELPLGGASGAVSACIGGFLLLMTRTQIELRWIVFLFFRFWSGEWYVPAWLIISFWFLNDLLGLFGDLANGGAGSGVACAAHVGGTLGGVAMAAWHKMRTRVQAAEAEALKQASSYKRIVPPGPATVYLYLDEQECGPYRRADVLEMLASGQIQEDTIHWEEGMNEWRPVSELSP